MKKTMSKIILLLLILCFSAFAVSCAGKEKNQSEDHKQTAAATVTTVNDFEKKAPDELKNLKAFKILSSDKYFVQIKETYLMTDMRMTISRDGDKYDFATETVRTYSHTIVKDGKTYKLDKEKKTYTVGDTTEEVKITFFDLSVPMDYTGVKQEEFGSEKANVYSFSVTDKNDKKSTLKFAVKENRLLGITSDQPGLTMVMTIEKISETLPKDAFTIPDDYKLS